MLDFTAIDFETANRSRASACSIGMVRVRGGQIVDEDYFLMRPPAGHDYFDPANTAVHGLTRRDVARANAWEDAAYDITDFIGDDVVVAHNAAFDLSVLRDAHLAARMPVPTLDFVCTVVLSRRLMKLPAYKLPIVSAAVGVTDLDHHHALSDARAAAHVAIALANRAGVHSMTALATHAGVSVGRITNAAYEGCTRGRR